MVELIILFVVVAFLNWKAAVAGVVVFALYILHSAYIRRHNAPKTRPQDHKCS